LFTVGYETELNQASSVTKALNGKSERQITANELIGAQPNDTPPRKTRKMGTPPAKLSSNRNAASRDAQIFDTSRIATKSVFHLDEVCG
jgi:hypothetical protein